MNDPLCSCFGVSEKEVREAIRNHGSKDLDDVVRLTAAGSGCQGCSFEVKRILQEEREAEQKRREDTNSSEQPKEEDPDGTIML